MENNITQTIAILTLDDGSEYPLKLAQKWPIRVPRPTSKRYPASKPLVTGQRILDTLFPIAKEVLLLSQVDLEQERP